MRLVGLAALAFGSTALAQIAFVQTTFAGPAATPTTEISAGLGTVGDGNLIIVATTNVAAAGVTYVEDGSGNVYTRAAGPLRWSTSYSTELWYAKNVTGGDAGLVVTVHLDGGSLSPFILYVSEYTGLDRIDPLDQVAGAVGAGDALVSSPARTTRFSDELLFGHAEGAQVIAEALPGWSVRNTNDINMECDRVVSSAGTYSVPFFFDGGVPAWVAIMATFRAPQPDAGQPDAGADAGVFDAGGTFDAGAVPDAGAPVDAGRVADAGAEPADAGRDPEPKAYGTGCGCAASPLPCLLLGLPMLRRRRLWPVLALLLGCGAKPSGPGPVMFAAVDALPELAVAPALMRSFDGTVEITTAEQWRGVRRGELKALLGHYLYGALPGGTQSVTVEKIAEASALLPGVDYAEYAVHVASAPSRPLHLAVFSPAGVTGAPVFLGLNKCGNQSLLSDARIPLTTSFMIAACGTSGVEASRGTQAGLWPISDLVAAGFALATFHESDAAPDDAAHFREGLLGLYDFETPRAEQWGALSAWAFALHRAVDALETLPAVDAKKVVLVGHSRRGKAALWASANDERIALTVAHQSGRGGAPFTRSSVGESVELINAVFPHWFNDVFPTFAGHETKLPVEQDALLALIAPRGLMLSDGDDDTWADPLHARASLLSADAAWKLLGDEGAEAGAGDELVQTRSLTWRHRPGDHFIGRDDWLAFIAWAKARL